MTELEKLKGELEVVRNKIAALTIAEARVAHRVVRALGHCDEALSDLQIAAHTERELPAEEAARKKREGKG